MIDPAERRAPIGACAGCYRAHEPYIYMSDGNHYCCDCARVVKAKLEYNPAGRRQDDMKEIPSQCGCERDGGPAQQRSPAAGEHPAEPAW